MIAPNRQYPRSHQLTRPFCDIGEGQRAKRPSSFHWFVKMATIRNLKIKTSACKRIVKELNSYKKEVEREAAKTADMKEKGADPYDLKQQDELLESDQKEGPEIEDAQNTIAEVEQLFQSTEP
ncbi:hypothetical protein Tsubulata_028961 [Turnera subulata]|uniref:Tubulin-specific chaperone A n=1 Tax=Turnera subulata TaxID=218843 RepID=A0A9Q0J0Z2_9ROSI|nr:hypothetical protein Tsubulata_028961 [Turnera subulata]